MSHSRNCFTFCDILSGMARWVWSMWTLMLTPVTWSWGRRSDTGPRSDVAWRRGYWTAREWPRSDCAAQATLQTRTNGAGRRYWRFGPIRCPSSREPAQTSSKATTKWDAAFINWLTTNSLTFRPFCFDDEWNYSHPAKLSWDSRWTERVLGSLLILQMT